MRISSKENSKIHPQNQFLNMIKGFGIILVVLGHCIQFGSGKAFYDSQLYLDNEIFRFIYSFHMPLFMLVSGYLYWFTVNRHPVKSILVTRFSKYLLPVLLWNTIAAGGFALIKRIVQGSCGLTLTEFLISYLTGLWFLWAIFWCSLIVLLVHMIFKDNIVAYIVIGGLIMLIPPILNAELYVSMYPYFVIAYLWNKHNMAGKFSLLTPLIRNSIILFITILFFVMMYVTDYLNVLDLIRRISPYFYGLVRSLSGCVMVLMIWKALMPIIPNKIGKSIASIGERSLGIYIIHGNIVTYILLRLTPSFRYNLLQIITETIVIAAASYVATLLLEKHKLTSKLFLGGR